MKLFFVLVIVIIFAGPTVAKTFSKKPVPAKKRGIAYRMVRRFGVGRSVLLGLALIVAATTVIYVTLGHA